MQSYSPHYLNQCFHDVFINHFAVPGPTGSTDKGQLVHECATKQRVARRSVYWYATFPSHPYCKDCPAAPPPLSCPQPSRRGRLLNCYNLALLVPTVVLILLCSTVWTCWDFLSVFWEWVWKSYQAQLVLRLICQSETNSSIQLHTFPLSEKPRDGIMRWSLLGLAGAAVWE